MFKYVLLAVVALAYIEIVLSLRCHVFEGTGSSTEEDCTTYLPRKAKENNLTKRKLDMSKLTPVCYTVQATATNGTTFAVKGCTLKDLCFIPMNVIRKESQKKGLTVETTCKICQEDLCNK